MNQPTELTALRQKLSQMEIEMEINLHVIKVAQTRNGVLAGMKSDCLKAITRLTLAKPEPPPEAPEIEPG